MIIKIIRISFLIFAFHSAYAYSQNVELNSKNPIHNLAIQAGVVAHISCGSKPQLHLQGMPSFLSQATYSLQGNTLLIDAHQNGGAIHTPTFITANIQLNSSVQSLQVQRGGFITLDACVVDKNHLSLDLQQGAHVYVNGHTKKLSVYSSMGGFLNKDGNHFINADQAFVNCTQGCILKMGQVKKISGHIMLGGQVYIPSSTRREGLVSGMGGHLYFN